MRNQENNTVDIDDVLRFIYRMTKKYDLPDEGWTTFNLWVTLTHLLAEEGWSPEDLMREAGTHAALQTSVGGIQ